MTSKLPTADTPLIQDPDLARAIEARLEPYTGKALEKAQAAVRRVHASGVQGPFATVVAAYDAAIKRAAGEP